MAEEPGTERWDRRPVPDPTVLTTEALNREIAQIEKSIGRDLTAMEKLLLGRVDRLHELLIDRDTLYKDQIRSVRRHGNAIHKSIEELTKEKFRGVAQQFKLIERQRTEQKLDTKQAVDAALAAAKEAVKEQTTASDTAINKSETSTSKQLDQLGKNFETGIGGVTTTVNDLKGRLTVLETSRVNSIEGKTENRASTAQVIATVVAAISSLALVVSVAGFIAYVAFHK